MAWTRINVRLPEELNAAIKSEADRLGMRQSEFIRQALAVHVAWHRALDAIEEGRAPADLREPDVIAKLLGEK